MSSPWYEEKSIASSDEIKSIDDAEKGLYEKTNGVPVRPTSARSDKKKSLHIDTNQWPLSPIHEGITPFTSVPELSLSWPRGFKAPEEPAKKPARPKPKISRWIRFNLWFNTYRKFFTFVVSLNLTGIILASLGRFPYAEDHLGALVLGNLLFAILMRNELFLRILYIIAIYGLRSVRISISFTCHHHPLLLGKYTLTIDLLLVGSVVPQARGHFSLTTCRRHPLGLRPLRRWVSQRRNPNKRENGALTESPAGWSSRLSISFGICLSSISLSSLPESLRTFLCSFQFSVPSPGFES